MIYARSDIQSVAVSEAHGGCNELHVRPEGQRLWGIECVCEDHLRTDPLWSVRADEVPESFDEARAAEALERNAHKRQLNAIESASGLLAILSGPRDLLAGAAPQLAPAGRGVQEMRERRRPGCAVLWALRRARAAGDRDRRGVTAPAAEQLLDELLPRFCESCGEGLAAPGEQCGSCGALPSVTRTEAAQRLAEPGAIALVRAARLRQDVQREHERLRGLLRQADMTEHTARLEAARDEIAARLPAARAEASRAARELKRAQGRERDAAARAEDARANFARCSDTEEAARRTGADAATRTDALMRLNAAAPVLEADQAAHRGAVAERERAEQALAGARGRVSALEAELAEAQQAVDEPGRAPKSVITLALDLVHQAQLEDLTETERIWVRSYGAAVAALTGAGEDIAARAVEFHERAQADAARNKPVLVQNLGSGNVAAIPNPVAPGTPQPFHPPAQLP